MSGCPSREQLALLLAEQLSDVERDSVEGHAEECATCQGLLEQLADETDWGKGRFLNSNQSEACCGASKYFLNNVKQRPPDWARPETVATVRGAPEPSSNPTASPEHGDDVRVEGYEILAEIGRGGMGVVYKARQLGLDRLVALKMILAGAHAGVRDLARFRTEAEAVARLQHPNIVQIHQVGEAGGCPFFSLEFVAGGSLAQKLAGKPQPAREAALLVESLARAMHCAHQHGIVHRDLKPGNIVLTPDGVAKITDFGIAKLLEQEGGVSQTGDILGTPEYMAPEQAAGRSKDIGPLTDVYALGAILYKMLTGRPPFQAVTSLDTLLQVRLEEPVPPRRLNMSVHPDLQAICLKCLEKEPARRYPSAEALADDLGRWLRGEPSLARPPGWIARVRRTARRHRAATLVVAVLALTAVLLPVLNYLWDPERSLEAVERQLSRGEMVTLIGNTGPPRWFRWRTDETGASLSSAPDGAFTIGHKAFGLLELLPNPQLPSYRLRAEVRHEQIAGLPDSATGIYFGHSDMAGDPSQRQSYFALAFNDLMTTPKPGPGPKAQGPIIPKKRGNDGETGARGSEDQRLTSQKRDNLLWFQVVCHPPKGVVNRKRLINEPHRFHRDVFPSNVFRPDVPTRGMLARWRNLAVEVRPEQIQIFWDDGPLPIGTHGRAALETELAKVTSSVAARFDVKNALGLYVSRASASFRYVAVEPLD
jgi:serine/threonine-protein kinase